MGKKSVVAVMAMSMVMLSAISLAEEYEKHTSLMNHGDGHLMDMNGGMVMGQNIDNLPGGCDKITSTKEITVHAGHKYSEKFPGTMFAFDKQEFKFEPCTKLTVHFINDDDIRHQWMMHGLPKYLHPGGMFHLEVPGPGEISGTFIVPPGDQTYLVHCDIAQHMEKGMKAQFVVGKGSGDLPSIPGLTANVIADNYNENMPPPVVVPVKTVSKPADATTPQSEPFYSGSLVIGLALGLLLAPFVAKKIKGMSVSEVIAYCFELIGALVKKLFDLIGGFLPNNAKQLPK